MGRFSLSPPNVQIEQRAMPYRDIDNYDDDVSADDSAYSSYSSSDDDDDSIPDSSWGRTRFSLSPPPRPPITRFRVEPDESDWMINPKPSLPAISSNIDANTAPTSCLLQYDHLGHHNRHDDEDVDGLTQLMEASLVVEHDPDQWLLPDARYTVEMQDVGTRMWALANAANRELAAIEQQAKLEHYQMEMEHKRASEALLKLIKRDEEAAKREQERIDREEQARVEAERELHERQEKEREKKEQAKQLKIKQQQEQDKKAKEEKEKEEQEKQEKERKRKEQEAKKTEHVTRAQTLVSKLVALQKSVEPFDKLKVPQVSKRRLGMKKLVRGKLNTLSHDANKVLEVSNEVCTAIREARAQDEQLKQEAKSNPQITSDMIKGKRYLMNLLSSNVITRIQADSFRGLKGDGFPLAAMLAQVSVEGKELVAILAAHIYTVCPMAIPSLPQDDGDLAKGLGMKENETFDKFIVRTEGIISMMADIMASKPSNHVLLEGHKGAVMWLERFLDLLPSVSPLPLLTAPVLDAFLTGAGNMLANKFPDRFKKHLDIITNDTIKRLDEGAIGQPSATRLKKLVAGGFDVFRDTLPEGAIPELYDGAETTTSTGGGPAPSSGLSSSGQTTSTPLSNTSTASASPFGKQETSTDPKPNPFAGPSSSTPSGFGTTSSTTDQSPFAGPSKMASDFSSTSSSAVDPKPSPFQSSSTASSMSSTGFGQTSMGTTSSSQSPFGTQFVSSPFGSSAAADGTSNDMAMSSDTTSNTLGGTFGQQQQGTFESSPFGKGTTTPFGGGPSPFGGGSSAATSSPFGKPTNPSPFGQQSTDFGLKSPFGAPASANSNPFGGGATAATSSPFGGGGTTSTTSPFGGGTTGFDGTSSVMQSSPFGGSSTQQQTTPFGSRQQQTTPFGGGAQQQTTPFGGGTQQQTTPFGGGSTQQQATPFGFGGSQQQTTPFGASNTIQSTPFGASTSTTPFGAPSQTNQSAFGGGRKSKPPPCKFWAQGRCKFGNNCKFSHEGPGGTSNAGSNTAFSSSYGGGGGGGGSSNPFGGPRR